MDYIATITLFYDDEQGKRHAEMTNYDCRDAYEYQSFTCDMMNHIYNEDDFMVTFDREAARNY